MQLVAFALGGGVSLALGDIAMQYSVAFLGLAVGPPILNALTIIVGVILSYFLDGGLNKPYLVFPGMACAAAAIGLGAWAHVANIKAGRKLNTADHSNNVATPDDCISPKGQNHHSHAAAASCSLKGTLNGDQHSASTMQSSMSNNKLGVCVATDSKHVASDSKSSTHVEMQLRQRHNVIQRCDGSSRLAGTSSSHGNGSSSSTGSGSTSNNCNVLRSKPAAGYNHNQRDVCTVADDENDKCNDQSSEQLSGGPSWHDSINNLVVPATSLKPQKVLTAESSSYNAADSNELPSGSQDDLVLVMPSQHQQAGQLLHPARVDKQHRSIQSADDHVWLGIVIAVGGM